MHILYSYSGKIQLGSIMSVSDARDRQGVYCPKSLGPFCKVRIIFKLDLNFLKNPDLDLKLWYHRGGDSRHLQWVQGGGGHNLALEEADLRWKLLNVVKSGL